MTHGRHVYKIGDSVGVQTHGLMLIEADLVITPDNVLTASQKQTLIFIWSIIFQKNKQQQQKATI